jgi:D-alanyl-D-alanine carboxypeptidase
MGNFYTDTLQKSPLFHSTERIDVYDLLEPYTRAAVMAILADAEAAGTPLMVFETYRSVERQQMLFDQGATQLRTVGTHGFGLACDLVKDIGGEPSWKGDFSFLGVLARKHGLIWGGDWGHPGFRHTFIDAVHVQRCQVSDQPKLFAGTWYPDATYDPTKVVPLAGDARSPLHVAGQAPLLTS